VTVHLSSSTWQQPRPEPLSVERSAVVEHVRDLVLALGRRRLRVGIDGFTAAGKTSFGHELAYALSEAGRPVLRASLDDFKKPWRDAHLYDRKSGEGYYRNAFDCEAIRRLLLEPAGPSGSGDVVLCSIDPITQVDHTADVTQAPSDAVLIVDGVFAFRPEINDCWDLRIWLDVSRATSIDRGEARDAEWGEAESVHSTRYAVAADVYLAEVDARGVADVVIDNADFAQPRVIRALPRPEP
jgi:uridine kinase